MNYYEAKQQARKERLEARAERLAAQGRARADSGWERLRAIPFGQPILIGHHSENRDRNYRSKACGAIDKGYQMQKEAGELAARAESVGTGGISGDDPDAPTKILERIAELEALQVKMVAANKAMRKGDDAALLALGFSMATIEAMKTPDYAGRKGFASYEMTNNGANIRRLKGRLEQLKARAGKETKETAVGNTGIRIVENVEANRLQIFFPGKPDFDTRKELKGSGFRWSPMEGAWQRHLSTNAKWAAEQIVKTKMEDA